MADNGLDLLIPSSITSNGGSWGTVSPGVYAFSSVLSFSMNGIFNSTYDNYMCVISDARYSAIGPFAIRIRMRASGVDEATASYASETLQANSTAVTATRTTTQNGLLSSISLTRVSGQTVYIFGPFLAQQTAMRSIDAGGASFAYIRDMSVTHTVSASYDGFTIFVGPGTMSGEIAVYGFNQ